jgi:hypothetical protein
MSELSQARDWFDEFWDQNVALLPVYLRGAPVKKIARELLQLGLKAMAKQAGTPDGVKAIIAFARVKAIVTGTKGVLDAPDPTPEQVAEAVERLVQRVKP